MKKYLHPEMEISEFENWDVLTASTSENLGPQDENDVTDDD